MTNQAWIYLSQLARALQVEGVDGRRAGEFVAEIDSHLTETNSDPVEEFGTPFELASEMATRPGSRRPGWLPPLWAIWILGMFVSVLAAAVIDRVALGDRPVGFVITERGTAWMVTFVLGVAVINRVTTVRLTGRSWAALFDGPTITLVLGVGVLTATVGELPSGTLVQLSPLVFWGLFGVSLLGFIFVVSKWNNPIRFPEHAQHLRRLSRGPFAKAPTARDSQEAER